MKIATIIGTRKAGENAIVEKHDDLILVTWDGNRPSKRFSSIDSFKWWVQNDTSLIERINWNRN